MNEITPKPLSDIERLFYCKPQKKVNAGIAMPPPEPPSAGASVEEVDDLILRLVAEGYGIPEICAVEGFPSAGEFLARVDATPPMKTRLRASQRIRAMILRETRLVNARAEGKTAAFELVARDIHIVDAPETNPAHKIEHSGAGGEPLSIKVTFVKPND